MRDRGKYARWMLMALGTPAVLASLGCTNHLVFATATKFGLDASQRADRTVELTVGYQRAEVVSVPACPDDGTACHANDRQDIYSVLGTFHVNQGNPFTMEPIEIQQVFATGMAARKASENKAIWQIFYDATTKATTEVVEGR